MAQQIPEQSTHSIKTDQTDTTTFFPDTDSKTAPTSNDTGHNPVSTLSQSQTQTQPQPQSLTNPAKTIHVELTPLPLSITFATQFTRSPTSGANVFFLGTTRSYFQDPTRPVSRLSYSAYTPLALRTLLSIATTTQTKYELEKICVIHRLGEVAVAEESIVVAVSAPHRGAAWAGAEELLELVKDRAEIWKREWFVDGVVEEGRDGQGGKEVGVWRDNRESDRMGKRKDQDQEGRQ